MSDTTKTISVEKNPNIEDWICNNEGKLLGYAKSLAARFPNPCFDADDIFQAMCMKLWRTSAASKSFLSKGDAYLFKTAWNEGLMMLRSERRYSLHIEIPAADLKEEPEIELELPDTNPTPEAIVLTDMDNEVLSQAITSLPRKTRQICKLLYAGKRPFEIAEELGVSRAHVSQTVERIRESFAQRGIVPA